MSCAQQQHTLSKNTRPPVHGVSAASGLRVSGATRTLRKQRAQRGGVADNVDARQVRGVVGRQRVVGVQVCDNLA